MQHHSPKYPVNLQSGKATLACLLFCLLAACENFNPPEVNFDQSDVVRVGQVHTLEIDGHVLASLPEAPPVVDEKKAALGKLLFWDPVLSGDQDVACASCHLPELAYTDGLTRSIGVGGSGRGAERAAGHTGRVRRNSQTLVNSVWNGIDDLGVSNPQRAPMFWDNRSEGLTDQAKEPIRDRQEMRGDDIAADEIESLVVQRLQAITEYRLLFADVYNDGEVSFEHIVQALAEFEKTLTANNSRFDQWMRGDPTAMTANELSAMREFVLSGCAECHSGPMFSDFETHVLGIADAPGLEQPDDGDGSFAFRTPALRQLDFTAPYFHNGHFTTLAAAIDFYDDRDNSQNPHVADRELDPELLDLSEMDDGRGEFIASFLKTLNDPLFDQSEPASVPSGLRPGGNL